MRLLISDANIFIDMVSGGLLEAMFRLPYRFAVPDVLYEEELAAHHPDLPDLGLQVLELSPDGIIDVQALLSRYASEGVTRDDVFALALARQEDCPLLTGDRALRNAGEEEQLEVHGTLWLVEAMFKLDIVSGQTVRQAYEAMVADRRRLPWDEVEGQLQRLGI